MFRLTREVRFAINSGPDPQIGGKPGNGFGGFPSIVGLGRHLVLQATLCGGLQEKSNYLLNIKDVDQAVRDRVVPYLGDVLASDSAITAEIVTLAIHERLRMAWPGVALEEIRLFLTPFFSVAVTAAEGSMVRLSQKFEFSASHRLHNPDLSDEENRTLFGKCNNPHGHGHNYEVEVALAGTPNESGVLIDLPAFERLVTTTVIDRLDHRNLNVEIPEFRRLNPTVENIARAIYEMLRPKFRGPAARLAWVIVWETPKTWCKYSEE